VDANKGHAFGIFMALVGSLQSLRSLRRRLPWALGLTKKPTLHSLDIATMNDERLYGKVVEELRQHGPVPGLWAKAYAEANGNKPQAEALYLRYRAEQLAKAEREIDTKENQSRDDLESLYKEVSSNLSTHAPFLISLLVIIFLSAASFFKE
jgi:hypothetical protein